jgi:hypothetical protein
MPDIAEVIARETNWYAQKFLENTPNLKLKFKTHCWAGIETYIIMKYPQYMPLEFPVSSGIIVLVMIS